MWVTVIIVGCVLAVGALGLTRCCRGHLRLNLLPGARQALLDDVAAAPLVLLLGPTGAGKSTLFRAALKLADEAIADEPLTSTRGLVRRPLFLPASQGRRHVILCDAGGGRRERRQWVELVRPPARVGALIFVADLADGSNDARDLFKQLASAKWARGASILLALTKLDALQQQAPEELDATTRAREAEYRSACPVAFSTHVLSCHDANATSRLLIEAVSGVGGAGST